MDFAKYSLFSKKDIIDIYHSWIAINKPLYIKYYNLIGLMIMALLIPLDFILYYENNIFTRYRIIYISIIIINLLFVQFNQKKIFTFDNYSCSIELFLPGILYNILYIYYLYITPENFYQLVLLANFITIVTTTMFSLKFWKEQYLISLFSIVFIVLLSLITGKYIESLYLIVIQLFSFILAYFYRRSFILSMYEKYQNTASLVPRNVAKHIAVTDGAINLDKIFEPKERFTVCLSSDWRNYQDLAISKDPKYIENIFQKFYNLVFEELDKIIPNGNYYADWTADELFIIFFDEDNNINKILKNALDFSNVYASYVFEEVNKNIDEKLVYDIGMASGVGLLGLQGPEKRKKTTITGESAGIAKRLETEAKNLRSNFDSKYPILIIDKTLYNFTKKENVKINFEQIKAKTKNIKDGSFYMWYNGIFTSEKQLEINL